MVEPCSSVSTEEVARHYDQLDRFYRGVWGEHVHHGYWKTGRETHAQALRAMVDLVIERAKLKPGMSVLDIGCGYGETARILAKECAVEVTGVTISQAQQRFAEGVTAPQRNPRFFLEDWLHNKQPSASFGA